MIDFANKCGTISILSVKIFIRQGGLMNTKPKEKYNDISIVSENREKQRAYYMPFSNERDALISRWCESDRCTVLNGEWNFKYF